MNAVVSESLPQSLPTQAKPDLDCARNIDSFVDRFYEKVLADDVLQPIFVDVAQIDLAKHLPLIKSYWRKLLLGEREYQRHTMNIHRAVNARQTFTPQAFERWLHLFKQTATEGFAGARAERAIAVASQIARNMQSALREDV